MKNFHAMWAIDSSYLPVRLYLNCFDSFYKSEKAHIHNPTV